MNPIRVEAAIVEPVSLAEMRGFLRLDPDDGGAEDALVERLIAAARAQVEAAARRILVPGRYRLMLTAWPADGRMPLPLSPLVAVARAGLVDA
ncbi:head-tail connector protein, partial [Methylobacterium goesingense]